MPINQREFDTVVTKFGFASRDRKHRFVWLEHEGKRVVRTLRSNQRGDLPSEYAIRKQLHLSADQLREAIACTMGLDDYIEHLRGKGVI